MGEGAGLEEAERQASHTVWADGYWSTLSGEDQAAALPDFGDGDHGLLLFHERHGSPQTRHG